MFKKAPALLVLVLGGALSAFAQQTEETPQPVPDRPGQALRQAMQQQQQVHPMQRWLRQQMMFLQRVGLTPEQQEQLREIPARHEGEWQKLIRDAKQARSRLERLMAAEETANPEAIQEHARAIGAAETALTNLVGQIWNEVKQALTPEQLRRLREVRQEQALQRRQQMLQNSGPPPAAAPNNRQRLLNQRRFNKLTPNAPAPVPTPAKP
jgi:Spy/CpxP family protein refolding chaperone